MKRATVAKVPTPTEIALDARTAHVTASALPISDPWLSGVSELLTRICEAQSVEVARWQAGDALVLLRGYVTSKQGEPRQ